VCANGGAVRADGVGRTEVWVEDVARILAFRSTRRA
jgi:hypothetical protein